MKWTGEMIAMLGTMTDASFADQYGRSKQSVSQMRHRLGIKPFEQRSNRVEITDEIVKHLGSMPDRLVAEKFGLSFWQVFHARRNLGINSSKDKS